MVFFTFEPLPVTILTTPSGTPASAIKIRPLVFLVLYESNDRKQNQFM